MKRTIIFLLALLFYIVPLQQAQAHVLKTDGSVGAVIHVSPEDEPIARESTDFYFEFKDKEGKFTPENCDCKGIILQNGKEIYSKPLFQDSTAPSLESASFAFTFPERDVYKVSVSGKPTSPGAFEPFTLSWDIRVARESTTNSIDTAPSTPNITTENTINYFPIIIGVVIALFFAIYFVLNQKKKKRKLV